jgi:hypothetical protein
MGAYCAGGSSPQSLPSHTLLPMDAGGCSHIENLFADDHTKANVLSKYEQLARWSVSRLQSGTPPSKRRKVCMFTPATVWFRIVAHGYH